MRGIGREYRVVCSQTDDKQVYIDIVPAEDALHMLILQERELLKTNVKLIAGSIKLYDMGEGNVPEILFLPPENGGLPTKDLSAAEENKLRYMIKAKFKEMQSKGLSSTLSVRADVMQKYLSGIVNKLNMQVENIDNLRFPRSAAEEREQAEERRQRSALLLKQQKSEYLRRRDEKYREYNTLPLKIKQLIQRDY